MLTAGYDSVAQTVQRYVALMSRPARCRVQGRLRHLRARRGGRLHQHQGAGEGDEDARAEPHPGGAAGDD